MVAVLHAGRDAKTACGEARELVCRDDASGEVRIRVSVRFVNDSPGLGSDFNS